MFLFYFILLNLLGWHWLIGSYRFQVYISFLLSLLYWLCYYSFPNFFLPFIPTLPGTHQLCSISPPLSSYPWAVHISSVTIVSYTILNVYPSILCLPITLLNPWTFRSSSPLKTLHLISISLVLFLFCLLSFCFWGSVVDSWDFAVILLFTVLIYSFFLDKSL